MAFVAQAVDKAVLVKAAESGGYRIREVLTVVSAPSPFSAFPTATLISGIFEGARRLGEVWSHLLQTRRI
jgi:hypothetical protein